MMAATGGEDPDLQRLRRAAAIPWAVACRPRAGYVAPAGKGCRGGGRLPGPRAVAVRPGCPWITYLTKEIPAAALLTSSRASGVELRRRQEQERWAEEPLAALRVPPPESPQG
ncbi:hypothetical protein SEVIR_2G121201v4 [Setaria viridis]